MGARTAKLSIASVFFTFFIDNLCWSIVFPIFAPYFLDPNNVLFSSDVGEAFRNKILGLFLMAFSLGQFFGGPFLGEYADRNGRKRALAVGIFFTLAGLAITAWSMKTHVLWLLFAGRVITGFFASNLSICLACISDLSPNEKAKVRNFGYLSVLGGLSFILGAFIGGKLSDASLYSIFTPDFPLWVAAALTGFNFLFVCFCFREEETKDPFVEFDLWESFRNIKYALRTEKIKRIYGVYFLFLFAWTILFQFTPVLVVQRFAFTSADIGNLALFMGVCWAFGSSYLSKLFLHRFSSLHILEWCLFIFTALCGLMALPNHLYPILLIVGFCVVVGGIAWPLCTGVISNMAPKKFQGKIMGMSQSIQSLAMTIAPVVGGMASHGAIKLPFVIAAFSGIFAMVVYFSFKRQVR